MNVYQPILHRAGATLVLLGVVLIYLSLWQFFETAPSSLLEEGKAVLIFIFAAIAWGSFFFIAPGVLLLCESLKAAKYIRYIALVYVAGAVLSSLILPLLQPLAYHAALLHLAPWTILPDAWGDVVYIAFFFWLQYLLGKPEIKNAQIDNRITPASTWPALWFSGACAVVAFVAMYLAIHSNSGNQALQRVRTEHGSRYQYFVNSIHWNLKESSTETTVEVIGYNPHEIRHFTLRWIEHEPVSKLSD